MTRALLACLALAGAAEAVSPPQRIVLEAEDAALTGVRVARELTGYSGTGYVTGFEHDGDRVAFTFTAAGGLYALAIRRALPDGEKGYDVEVNGEKTSGMFTGTEGGFRDHDAGVFELRDGVNTVIVGKGWGWWVLDAIALSPATVAPPAKPPKAPVDPLADAPARALLARLVDLYGAKTLAGQQDLEDIAFARSVTGREPALGSFDLMEYSPSRLEHGADPAHVVERAIAWSRSTGGVVQLMWHWNAPSHLIDRPGGKEWWRGFYTEATTFDLAAVLADPAGEDHRLLLRDLDAMVPMLRRFQAEKIPVLWRPLHEAQGGWFWWGAKGPQPFVRLWRLMFERYTRRHGLHHLLWVYGPPGEGVAAREWYPGDDVVDALGVSIYADATSGMSGQWRALQRLCGGRKLVGLSECGAPPPMDRVRRYQARWSWFSVWSGDFIRTASPAALRAAYADPDVLTGR